MKRIPFLIPTLLLVTTCFLPNGFAQDYVHYATLTGHKNAVNSVVFSPDGKTLASGSWDNTIRLWDATTGKHLRTLTGHTNWVNSIAFSRDGQTLASASSDKTIRLWDVLTGRSKITLRGHTGLVFSVSFSPDDQTLASGSTDTTLRLWNASVGTHLCTLIRNTYWVNSVSFSPDGRTLASGGSDKTFSLWDAVTRQHKKTHIGHPASVNSISFSPDGRTLASGSSDKTIRLWDVPIGRHKITLTGHTGSVNSISFSPSGRTLASGSSDKTIRLWDIKTDSPLQTLIGHTGSIRSVSFNLNNQMLASGSLDKTIRLWRVSPPRSTSANLPIPTPSKSTADQIYNNAIRSVMWIVNPGIGEGSGVLIDKQFKLAITNAHVTDKQNTIDVYFPAPDENGKLIKDRNFYVTSSDVLKRLGYYTKGHVVAKDEKTDLAIIRLEGLPETAREIDWNFTTPTTNTSDLVYILGNPGGQNLWRWTLGEFLNDHGDFLHIQSDVFGGNSGGPVLNKQGVLLGIIARSDRHMNALAIPVKDINRLLSESQLKHSRSRR